MLKLPGSQQHVYYDEHSSGTKFVDVESIFNGGLADTMNSLYKASKSSTGWIMYNDDPPVGRGGSSRAHAKGVLAMTKDTGFWSVLALLVTRCS